MNGTVANWKINEPAYSEDYYTRTLTTGEESAMSTLGWTVQANVYMLGSYPIAGNGWRCYLEADTASHAYYLSIQLDANRIPQLYEYSGGWVQIPTASLNLDTGFHTYSMTAAAGLPDLVSVAVDGTTVLTGWTSTSASSSVLSFGSGSGLAPVAELHFAQVSLSTIPEPSTVVLLLTAGVVLLAYAWRKRKCVPS